MEITILSVMDSTSHGGADFLSTFVTHYWKHPQKACDQFFKKLIAKDVKIGRCRSSLGAGQKF